MTLTLAEANSIVDATIAKARELNITVSVAVCDNLCYLIALNRMDGAYREANRFAYGKALVSSSTGLPSGEVKGNVDHPVGAYLFAQGVPAVRIQGGLPIFRNGQIEGACGVAGASSGDQEEECARAGIASVLR
jgi:uncharacterized protein GlcG (DUF336 family)